MSVSYPYEVLLAAIRRFLGTESSADVRLLHAALEDAWQFEGIAFEQGLAGILALQFRELSGVGVRRSIEPPCWHQQIFVGNSRHLDFLHRLGLELGRRDVECMVLKGAANLAEIYDGRLGLRPLSDIDLLVAPEHKTTLVSILEDLGLRSYGLCFRSADLEVDLHTDLLGADTLGRRHRVFCFDSHEIWARSGAFGREVGPLRTLSADLQILHQAAHLLTHSYSRWIWLVDLALMVPHTDPCQLVETALRTRTLRPLSYSVTLLESLFRLPVPDHLGSRLARFPALERRAVSKMVERPQKLACGKAMAAYAISGWWSRLGYLWELSFPNRRVLSWYYPLTASPWLYLRRLLKAGTRLYEMARIAL